MVTNVMNLPFSTAGVGFVADGAGAEGLSQPTKVREKTKKIMDNLYKNEPFKTALFPALFNFSIASNQDGTS